MTTRTRTPARAFAVAAACLALMAGPGAFASQQRPPLPPGATPPQGTQPRLPGDPRPATESGQPVNVKVDVTISDQTGTTPGFKKTMSLIVADRQSGSIRSRFELPVPGSTFAPLGVVAPPASADTDKDKGASPTRPVTWNFRSLGLNLDVREITVEGNYVRLRPTLEYSPVDENAAGADPRFAAASAPPPGMANFQQTLSLVLENGKPLVVAQTSDPVPTRDRKQTVEVRATILR